MIKYLLSFLIISNLTFAATNPVVIGMAFGSGGAKAFAEIGAIRAFEENGIKPQIIVGTSAGSIVGSLYAGGYNSYQIESIVNSLNRFNLQELTVSKYGFILGTSVQNLINKSLKNKQIQELPIKFAAVATDLKTGKPRIFNTGNIGLAVRASCAIPGIFVPVTIEDKKYLDGAVSIPVPSEVVRQMGANFIIAINITGSFDGDSDYFSMIIRAMHIMEEAILKKQLEHADVIISPDVTKLASLSFSTKEQAIKLGYKETLKQIPFIKRGINHLAKNQNAKEDMYVDGNQTRIIAGDGNNKIHLGRGNYAVYAGNGDDSIWSEAGNSYLNGGEGADMYYISLDGDTKNVVEDSWGENTLILDPNVFESQLVIKKIKDDLVITYTRSKDKITIKNWSKNKAHSHFALRFTSDGHEINLK